LFNADDAAFPPVAAGTSAWPTHQNTCPTLPLHCCPRPPSPPHYTHCATHYTRATPGIPPVNKEPHAPAVNGTSPTRCCCCSVPLAFARCITCGFVDCETFPSSSGRIVPPTWQQPWSTHPVCNFATNPPHSLQLSPNNNTPQSPSASHITTWPTKKKTLARSRFPIASPTRIGRCGRRHTKPLQKSLASPQASRSPLCASL
jgi:hypothetical protein